METRVFVPFSVHSLCAPRSRAEVGVFGFTPDGMEQKCGLELEGTCPDSGHISLDGVNEVDKKGEGTRSSIRIFGLELSSATHWSVS